MTRSEFSMSAVINIQTNFVLVMPPTTRRHRHNHPVTTITATHPPHENVVKVQRRHASTDTDARRCVQLPALGALADAALERHSHRLSDAQLPFLGGG